MPPYYIWQSMSLENPFSTCLVLHHSDTNMKDHSGQSKQRVHQKTDLCFLQLKTSVVDFKGNSNSLISASKFVISVPNSLKKLTK